MVRGKSGKIKYYQIRLDALNGPDGRADHPYAVCCIETADDVGGTNDHPHVVALGTKKVGGRALRWTVVHVIAATRDGALFVVGTAGARLWCWSRRSAPAAGVRRSSPIRPPGSASSPPAHDSAGRVGLVQTLSPMVVGAPWTAGTLPRRPA